MSKPKKRKPNHEALQKLQKAGSMNEYKRRMKALCEQIGFGSKFKMLERDIRIMHMIRPRSVRVFAMDDRVPEAFTGYVRSFVESFQSQMKTPAYEGGPEVTWGDYNQLVEPLRTYIDVRAEANHPVAAAFADILKIPQKHQEVSLVVQLAEIIEMMGLSESSFVDCYFRVEVILGTVDNGSSMRETIRVEVRSEAPSWKQIRIGAGRRVAARMGFAFPKAIEWMKLRPSQLGIRRKVEDNSPMDVYILRHAAQRLYQRIGGKFRDVMNMSMILSLFDLRAFPTGAGNFLIEHRIHGVKVGYYAATITDGVLLIRTFLLITHSGTPEGRKLAALTGLGKHDHKYMAFDSLPALATSDLLENEETRRMFVEAGCGGLMTFCDQMREKAEFYHLPEKPNMVADKLLQYIRQGREEVSDLWTDDEPDEQPETVEAEVVFPEIEDGEQAGS
jgi:hypothetical protein